MCFFLCSDIWGEEPAACGGDPAEGHHHPAALLSALLGTAAQHPGHPAAAGTRARGGQVTHAGQTLAYETCLCAVC